jgi:hypothetical protein
VTPATTAHPRGAFACFAAQKLSLDDLIHIINVAIEFTRTRAILIILFELLISCPSVRSSPLSIHVIDTIEPNTICRASGTPGKMQACSSAIVDAAAATPPPAAVAAAEAPPPPPPATLPRDVLVHVFSFLPRGALAVTPGRVSRAWAAAKAEAWAALEPPAPKDPYADEGEDLDRRYPFLPEHYLYEAYDGAASYDEKGKIREIAAGHGHLRFLARHAWDYDPAAVQTAARLGQLLALRLFVEIGRLRNPDNLIIGDCYACQAAARGGHLDALVLLRAHTDWDHDSETPARVFESAAEGGSLRVMEYCLEQGFPMSASTCAAAAKGGHRDAIVWLRQRGCQWDVKTCRYAAYGGHLNLLRLLRHEQDRCPWDESVTAYAAAMGRIDVLEWCRANGLFPSSDLACKLVADIGRLETLKYCLEQGYPFDIAGYLVEEAGKPQWDKGSAAHRACVDWLKTLLPAAEEE